MDSRFLCVPLPSLGGQDRLQAGRQNWSLSSASDSASRSQSPAKTFASRHQSLGPLTWDKTPAIEFEHSQSTARGLVQSYSDVPIFSARPTRPSEVKSDANRRVWDYLQEVILNGTYLRHWFELWHELEEIDFESCGGIDRANIGIVGGRANKKARS
jgi:hypothetical protein